VIEIFRTNQFFATLLLIPYTFLIRVQSLIYPSSYALQDFDSPFSKALFTTWLSSPVLQSVLACVVVFLVANFINRHIIQNRLSKYQSLIPGLFFVLITAGMPGGMICSPAMLSCFFILLGLLSINRIYKTTDAAIRIFNTGLYFSFATLLYPANSILWVMAVIAILILRSFKVSEILILISGLVIPLFLCGTYYYWNGDLSIIWEYFQFGNGILGVFLIMDLMSISYLVAIGIVVLYCILRYNNYTMKNAIQVQKKVDIVYWLMLFCLLSMFFSDGLSATHLVILAIPFAIFIGLSFEKMKSSLLAEVLHIGIIVAILVGHFT